MDLNTLDGTALRQAMRDNRKLASDIRYGTTATGEALAKVFGPGWRSVLSNKAILAFQSAIDLAAEDLADGAELDNIRRSRPRNPA